MNYHRSFSVLQKIVFGIFMLVFYIQCSAPLDLTKSPKADHLDKYILFIEENAPSREAFNALQRLTEPYLNNRQWDQVKKMYENHREKFPNMQNWFDQIIAILDEEEEGLIITNQGRAINTVASEYAPVLSTCETRLYFTGYDRSDGFGGEDIFYSDLVNGKWTKAINLGRPINTPKRNESLDGISSDGNILLMMGNYRNSLGSGDIYFAERTADGWGDLQHFPRPVNTEFFEGNATMSSDGKAMLFTSDRPGCIGSYNPKGFLFNSAYVGNTDIYVVLKTEQGWSEPINLGPDINTPFAEYSPFIHPDGKTLYFSSDGHPGLGRMDVFKSTRLEEESWTKWSKPVNLGKEINTPGHDWGYIISTTGNLAYFSSNTKTDTYGRDDIYSITMPQKQVIIQHPTTLT